MEQDKSVITVEPCGGLGNRMRVLDAGIALARALECELHLVWTLRQQMPARFEALFEMPRAIASLRQLRDPYPLRWLRLRRAARAVDRFIDSAEASRLVAAGYPFAELKGQGHVLIRTVERFYPNAMPFADLVPAESVWRDVEGYQPALSQMIGVHIRRQDNRASIASSPTALFMAHMHVELAVAPATEFFLATDDLGEEARLRTEFGARLHSHPKSSVRRGSAHAARDAAVDLYCLAGCRKLLGSHYSSFTDTAAAIRRIPLEIVRR